MEIRKMKKKVTLTTNRIEFEIRMAKIEQSLESY